MSERREHWGRAITVVLLSGLFSAGSALGQDAAGIKAATAACGPVKEKFAVSKQAGAMGAPEGTAEAAESGQARVVIAQPGNLVGFTSQTFRVGIDGAWAGAVAGSSWQAFTVAPGEHHVCVNWESHWKVLAEQYAMANLEAEAGKTYYLQLTITGAQGAITSFNLVPVDVDEGKYLMASLPGAVSHRSK